MAFRKEIFLGLKKKHASVHKDILNKVADHLEKGVTEETEVDGVVEESTDFVSSISTLFQSETDKRVAAVLKEKGVKTDDEEVEEEAKKAKAKAEGNDDTPAWAKSLIETNQALTDRLNKIEQGKTVDSRKSVLEGKLKDSPAPFKNKVLKDFGRMSFESDDDFNTYLEDTEADLLAFNQDISDKGLSSQSQPLFGNKGSNDKEASKAEVDTLLDSIM